MKWIKRTAIVFGVLLVILAALPFFISLDHFIPQIEKEASAKLNVPVSVRELTFSVLPLPHIAIDGITIGKTADVTLGTVKVTPDLFSLLGPTKTIRSIEIDSLMVSQKAIDKFPVWFKSETAKAPQQAPPVRVQRIRLDNAVIRLDKTSIGPFDAQVSLDGKGDPEVVSVTTHDGKLKALVTAEKSNFRIEVNAKFWKLPFGPALIFDELTIKGVATFNDASFNQIGARLYGGTISGKAALGWQRGMQLKGNLDINQVELKRLVPLLSPGTNVSGKLSARPVFSASAASAAQLMNSLRMETPFDVKNGVLYGVDIQKAATSLIKQGSSGGETHFDQLSGHMNMEHGAYRFTQLKIASGVLMADGNVSISSSKELAGRVNAKVGAGLASAGIPLDVSGTVDSPMLLPSKAMLAGAAAGTVLLPGVGTGLGAKLGQAVEGLFGRKDEKKP